MKEVEKGDLYDDQYNNSPREGKKENENGNNNEYDNRPTILGGNTGLPNGGKSSQLLVVMLADLSSRPPRTEFVRPLTCEKLF